LGEKAESVGKIEERRSRELRGANWMCVCVTFFSVYYAVWINSKLSLIGSGDMHDEVRMLDNIGAATRLGSAFSLGYFNHARQFVYLLSV
jgi:hypothetical protein